MSPQRILAFVLSLAVAPAAWAAFSSGSNGSDGVIDVLPSTTLTIPVPPDGIIHATTVTIGADATLDFLPNALNTPVYLLATGDIVVDGTISVRGRSPVGASPGAGGPGGFGGGTGGHAALGFAPGSGRGPGAGLGGGSGQQGTGGCTPLCAGPGSFATLGGSAGVFRVTTGYGSPLLLEMVGGSGGGGSQGTPGEPGSGGGGALLLASSTRIAVSGTIDARGGSGIGTHGSGGAVRLVAPIVSGTGTLDVRNASLGSEGAGRIRIDANDRSGAAFVLQPFSTGNAPTTFSSGAFMVVFPPVQGGLRLKAIAGRVIADDEDEPVVVTLGAGEPTTQPVTVRVTGLSGIVELGVVLTPEVGDRVIYPLDIDTETGNPAEGSVMVDFPVNTPVHVTAWTR